MLRADSARGSFCRCLLASSAFPVLSVGIERLLLRSWAAKYIYAGFRFSFPSLPHQKKKVAPLAPDPAPLAPDPDASPLARSPLRAPPRPSSPQPRPWRRPPVLEVAAAALLLPPPCTLLLSRRGHIPARPSDAGWPCGALCGAAPRVGHGGGRRRPWRGATLPHRCPRTQLPLAKKP